MRLSTYRFADYRLAAYVVVAALVGGGIALAIDTVTAPKVKVEANGAPAASSGVRQIAISKTTAADLGDPDGKLSPVYPAAPGKDLPVKDTPVVAAKAPAAPQAETNGSANATGQSASGQTASPAPATAAVPVAAAPVATAASQPANACNVQACAAAYRSFRESDCSYQPMVGARRVCEGAPGLGGPSSTGQIASQPPQQQPQPQQQARRPYDPNSTAPVGRSRYDDELRDTQRAARNLPPPSGARDDDDDDDNVTVIEAPQQRYDIRRNWIMEPQD